LPNRSKILHFKVVIHHYNFGCGSLTALPQFFSWNLGILHLREKKEGKREKKWEKERKCGEKRKQENRKGTKVRKRKRKKKK